MNINIANGAPVKTKDAIKSVFADPRIDVPMAFSVRIPRQLGDGDKALVYLTKDKELSQEFDGTTVKNIMSIMDKLYLFEDIFGRVVDLWTSFGATHLAIQDTKNAEYNKLIEYWQKHINEENQMTLRGISPLKRLIFHQLVKLGNVMPYETWKKVQIGKKTYRLPMKITCLNPQAIDIDEYEAQFGQEKLSLVLTDNFFETKKPSLLPIKRLLTKRKIEDFLSKRGTDQKIPLNSKLIVHLKRSGNHHSPWGIPFGTRALNAIAELHRKRLMDSTLIQSMIRRILHFKIGTDEFPCMDTGRLSRFKSLLNDPEDSMLLITPHDITHEDISPDMTALGIDKYEHDVMRVMIALGAPPVLLGLPGSKYPEVEVSAFAESLRDLQETASTYFEIVLEKIAQQNGFDVEPSVKMSMVNVNRSQHVNTMREIYFTGNLSHKSYLESVDIDYETEKKRREQERKDGVDELFTPQKQPFQGEQTTDKEGDEKDNEKKDEMTEPEKRKDDKKKLKKKFASVEKQIESMEDLKTDFYALEDTLKAFCKCNNIYYDEQNICNIRDMFADSFVKQKRVFASTICEAIIGD